MVFKSLFLSITALLALVACDSSSSQNNSAINKADLRTVTLDVKKMTCAACPITVSLALKKVSGVGSVKVSYKTKTAIVSFDSTVTNVSALTTATTNAGYPSTLKKKP